MIRSLYILALVCISFLSCGEKYYFEQTIKVDANGWDENKAYIFNFEILDTLQKYNLVLDVEHHIDYNYQNLYVKINTKYPDNHSISDTLSFNLSSKAGNWNGICRGAYCNLSVFLASKINFEEIGAYEISFNQFSRANMIEHINQLSLKLEEIE